MTGAHLLVKRGYGVYALSPNYRWRGLDVGDHTENAIARFLRERGGVARTREIHEAVGDRPVGGQDRGYGHRRITQALKASPLFRQDFGRGCWNLEEHELERLPLLGRWADYQIQVRWFENGERSGFESWEAKRADFFDSVGTAFMEARGELSLAEVARHPGIREALRGMGDAAPNARGDALDGLHSEVEGEARASGLTDQWAIAQNVRDRKDSELPMHLYAAFEFGDVRLHLAAPVEFYIACASFFGVCAAGLSRGQVLPLALSEADGVAGSAAGMEALSAAQSVRLRP